MPIFSRNSKHYLFVHIPKCGGTAIESLFRRSGFDISYLAVARDGLNGALNKVRRCSPQHMHAEVLLSLFDMNRFEGIFTIVRNPLERFRSEYLMRNRSADQFTNAMVESWSETILGSYSINPYVLDNHIRPQCEFIVPGSKIYVLERGLSEICLDINACFGLDLDPADLRHEMRGLRGSLGSSDVPISTSLEARLGEFYRRDYDLFYPDHPHG